MIKTARQDVKDTYLYDFNLFRHLRNKCWSCSCRLLFPPRPRGEQEKGDEKTGPCALDFRQQNDYILLMYGIWTIKNRLVGNVGVGLSMQRGESYSPF